MFALSEGGLLLSIDCSFFPALPPEARKKVIMTYKKSY